MSKKPEASAPRAPPIPAEPESFIVGLRKMGPKRYQVVTGTLSEPIFNTTEDPLEYACEALKLSVHKMLQIIP